MNRTLLVALFLASAARGAGAQTDTVPPRVESASFTDGLVRYSRWVTAAGAVALTLLATQEHGRAERHWDRLNRICRADNTDCVVAADGHYADPTAEAEYQATIDYDRRARGRLVAGQIALAVTVGLFIIDVGRGGGGPENIPLAPLEVTVAGDGARVGVRLAF
ncbi:MAG: hypothetical protein ACREMR_00055 [Gemmatimonadales bacterium]